MKNILVLDDNRSILDVLSSGLCRHLHDCKIMTAHDEQTGMNILRSVPIDLILTDLDIPAAKGYGFIEHAVKHYPAIPLCVMTGNCSSSVRERLEVLGISRYIEKPFQLDSLAEMITGELARQRTTQPVHGSGDA